MIYAVGDSHIRLIGGTMLSPSFTAMSSYYNELLATNINSTINVFDKENDYLILCFGEIDIRMHISKYCIKDNIIDMPKLYDMIEMVIDRYMKTIIKYALKYVKSNTLLGFNIQSNGDEDFCNDLQHSLDIHEDNIWLVDKIEMAEYVKNNSTEWYNAGYNTPSHQFKPNELEVVKVTINVGPPDSL